MKVISMVPSWTETLLACGVDVVGRTRFCVHPSAIVKDIPILGGTKDIDWDKVYSMKVDLLLLDIEENPQEFAEECKIPYHASHVHNISTMAQACMDLAQILKNDKLQALADRWKTIEGLPVQKQTNLLEMPGIVEWWRPPSGQTKIEYLIWKKPWMAVGPDTFIASVISKLGYGSFLPSHEEKYPVFEMNDISVDQTCLLLASEPYPFAKKKAEMLELPYAMALLDGEKFSWFGLRSLEFLERHLLGI